jgi:penicillin amidase
VLLVLAAGAGGVGLRAWLRASLPQLDGQRTLPGLGAPVRIERDALGVPVVRGRSRGDVARATGFLHAQERFFQMDLLRRRAAGELAELVGKAGLALDRETRVLRLRSVARRATAALSPEERDLLAAYTGGVNAGLHALGARPFEYGVLGVAPRDWAPEDSLLCALAMFLTLQDEQPARESALGLMHDVLPPEVFAFLAPRGTEWDAPLEGGPLPPPPVPEAAVLDLRRTPPAAPPPPEGLPTARLDPLGLAPSENAMAYGSNNWAVAGTHTVHGGAILANDMHLGLAVPNIWYLASLVFPGKGEEVRVTGVMLPGAPFVVVGSNGHVAWGFTNTQGDWADLVELEPAPGLRDGYLTPEGPRELDHATETIHVKGGADETLEVLSTVWGPVVDVDHRGRRRALAWVPLREGGLNAALFRMEAVKDLDEALALAPEVGIPHQNFVCADAAGRIGWTIMGRMPRRVGFAGRLPSSWADGSHRWDGWRRPEEYPRVVDPPGGRLWTANARVAGGRDLAVEGFGGYDLGARAGQIRDDLRARDEVSEADMLRIQLDDRAVFLSRWRDLLLGVLSPEKTARSPLRAEARRLVEGWSGRASVDSVGYRLVRAFRQRVARAALEPLLAPCREADPRFDYLGRRPNRGIRQWEGPLWALVTGRPPHLLDPRFSSWDELLLASLDGVLDELTRDGRSLSARTWGERNTVLIQHPLSRALPGLGRWLDMPREELPGDGNMPRVQYPRAGASERLVVSPGHEEKGLFHMPCGESGHPLSPHYRDGHEAWARGEPTPFLPGPALHVLTLRPPR